MDWIGGFANVYGGADTMRQTLAVLLD